MVLINCLSQLSQCKYLNEIRELRACADNERLEVGLLLRYICVERLSAQFSGVLIKRLKEWYSKLKEGSLSLLTYEVLKLLLCGEYLASVFFPKGIFDLRPVFLQALFRLNYVDVQVRNVGSNR